MTTIKKNRQNSGQASGTGLPTPEAAGKSLAEERLNAAVSDINAALAELEGSGTSGAWGVGRGEKNHSPRPTPNSQPHPDAPWEKSPWEKSVSPSADEKLPAPQGVQVAVVGRTRFRVQWEPVAGASGYSVRYSPSPAFDGTTSWNFAEAGTSAMILYNIRPDTTYHIGVRALGTGSAADSVYSATVTLQSGSSPDGDDGPAGQFQRLLGGLQTVMAEFSAVLPQLEGTSLSPAERRRLMGSGVRRYGFIDKVSDVAAEFPQFWPASVHGAGVAVDFQDALKGRLREIESLRNLLVWLRILDRIIGDLLLLAGDDGFRMANTYYASVHSAARSHIQGAPELYQLLRLFWRNRRNVMPEEPTLPTELYATSATCCTAKKTAP